MSTPYDGKILLVLSRGCNMPGKSIADVAALIRQKMPNVAGIFLQTNQTYKWQATWDDDVKAITGPGRIKEWVDVCAQHGLEIHVWGIPRGDDVVAEAEVFVQAASVAGVKSVALDVEHGEYYWNGTPAQAQDLMARIRDGVGDDFHVAMILDGRKNRPFFSYVDPFEPFADSLHPMVYPIVFQMDIEHALNVAFDNLAPYDKPIVPMLQSYLDVPRRPTAAEITQQGRVAFDKGAVGLSFFRLGDDVPRGGDDLPHMGDPEYAAIAAIQIPSASPDTPVEDEDKPVLYSFQDVINAFCIVAIAHHANYIDWISAAGLWSVIPSGPARNDPYTGADIMHLPALTQAQKVAILQLVEEKTSAQLIAMASEAQEKAEEEPEPRRKATGSIIGMHGAPGHVAPWPGAWDTWISFLKDMGVRWYKQCDDGSGDTGPNSIFQWVMRLRDEGITPIIRYLQGRQFPDRLDGRFFHKMQLYAGQGITWAEIGNEPNLSNEWRHDWVARVDHNDPGVIRAIAETWLLDAERSLQVGVKPAFYAFAPTDWRLQDHQGPPPWSSVVFTDKVCQYLGPHHLQRTRDVFDQGGWIAVHCATYENPCDFDPYGQGRNVWDMTLRSYEVVLSAFEKRLNIASGSVVIMSTEGGVFTPASDSMRNHPRLPDDQAHAERVIEMFQWLEENSPLQAMCPWCISVGSIIGHGPEEFQRDGWIEQVNDQLRPRPVVAALRKLRNEREAQT